MCFWVILLTDVLSDIDTWLKTFSLTSGRGKSKQKEVLIYAKCLFVVWQMITNSPLLAGNPELQQQMVQMLPTMVERVYTSCFLYFILQYLITVASVHFLFEWVRMLDIILTIMSHSSAIFVTWWCVCFLPASCMLITNIISRFHL